LFRSSWRPSRHSSFRAVRNGTAGDLHVDGDRDPGSRGNGDTVPAASVTSTYEEGETVILRRCPRGIFFLLLDRGRCRGGAAME
jgi:hypothetical protein